MLQKSVKKAEVKANVDTPEGGFDALMQTMVCHKEIGWRDDVRKIIVFSTDAKFHHAGDGRLAGIEDQNTGICEKNDYLS